MAQVVVSQLQTWLCHHCDWELVIMRPWDGRGGAKQQAASHVGSCWTSKKWWHSDRGAHPEVHRVPGQVELHGELAPRLVYVLE